MKDARDMPQTIDAERSVDIVVGAQHIERRIANAGALLRQFRRDTGGDYFDYQPVTPRDILVPEDLAVTLLINSQVSWNACRSLLRHGKDIALDSLPAPPLEATTETERRQVASVIAKITQWPGFGASVATKVLHKKRPDLVPILDNQAIFGAYMSKSWPKTRASADTVKDVRRIAEALDWIAFDITRPENTDAWVTLRTVEPSWTLTELFDGVWWMYFRETQPVQRRNAAGTQSTLANDAAAASLVKGS